jgi:hypothetical protein
LEQYTSARKTFTSTKHKDNSIIREKKWNYYQTSLSTTTSGYRLPYSA